jgi:hypothetical protein
MRGDSRYPIEPFEFDGVSTYPISERASKVHVGLFGKPAGPSDTVGDFIAKLPEILGGVELRDLVAALVRARSQGRPILWGMGGHVIKCGLGPILIDLMRDGFVAGLAMNGSAAIHDFEIGLHGSTSEEVEDELRTGRFGMARETGEFLNRAINEAAADGIGVGEGIGRFLGRTDLEIEFKHLDCSVLNEAYARSIPVTVHLAVGTDIINVHPTASGESLGKATMRDFKLLSALVSRLEGGVYLNVGSAVILPEVFLKALSVARNLGHSVDRITTVNLDFIQHYRPRENVLKRPTRRGGRAIALTGHHEIMLPLLAAALKQAQR